MPRPFYTRPLLIVSDTLGISTEARDRVAAEYLRDLAEHADQFLLKDPLAHESLKFTYEYAILDSGFVYRFLFYVDGSHMEMGVAEVFYVDCDKMSSP